MVLYVLLMRVKLKRRIRARGPVFAAQPVDLSVGRPKMRFRCSDFVLSVDDNVVSSGSLC